MAKSTKLLVMQARVELLWHLSMCPMMQLGIDNMARSTACSGGHGVRWRFVGEARLRRQSGDAGEVQQHDGDTKTWLIISRRGGAALVTPTWISTAWAGGDGASQKP
jgi:hypothetical protein